MIDAGASLAFVLALFWGYHNYRHELEVTEFWTTYMMAAVAGSVFTGSKALEWAGVMPVLMDTAQPFIGAVFATVLLVSAVVCTLSPVERAVQ